MYGSPVYGSPVYGSPVYGSPVYGSGGGGGAGVIGFVPTCPGGPHCCDTDPCTCEAPAGPASAVYPNPVYAARFYPAAVARRYQATGRRRSSAVPAAVPDDAVLLDVPAWEQAGGGPVVRVAVIDTGWSQPFGGDCWLGSNPPLPNAAAGGGDSPDGDGDGAIDPVSGHGLFIAGLLLMYGPANIAVDVRHVLHPEGDGAESDVVKAIDALMTQRCPPHILNLSFGGYALEKPEALGDAITKAQKAGIIVVASAGTDGLPRKQYPAAFPGVISVAALGPNGPAPFSNWGEWVRACAPGVDLVSGFWDYDGEKHKPPPDSPERFDGWAMWSGTSFAAPMVAAALARDLADGLTASEAVSRRIDHPRLFRLACHGAVVNPMTRRPEI